MIVRSTDGVDVAVHDLGGPADRPTVIVSHATGFHAWSYQPLAAALAPRHHSIGFDYRGHGDTRQPAGVPVDWNRYADDAEAVASTYGTGLIGFGHSMGGACLLIVAHRRPELFSRLVVFEPIVFDPNLDPDDSSGPPMLATIARRRRSTFPSYEAAIANFAAKPPLSAFTPEALDAYVRHGFREGEDGQIHLKCDPELEATTFEMSRAQTTWDMLPSIEIPVVVVCGAVQPDSPALHSRPVADRLPAGRYVQLDELDHFAPMTHPEVIADLV
jgi:pimeloyl-ACP methyl ester carboxylesterase